MGAKSVMGRTISGYTNARELTGMELAKSVREHNNDVSIVFVTGITDYLQEGYEVEALHYLIKPVNEVKSVIVWNAYVKSVKIMKKSICLSLRVYKLFAEKKARILH